MKLRRLQIEGYKNVRSCDVDFTQSPLINAVIGSNGSGKSNLIEAILELLVGYYFGEPPSFDFTFEFETNGHVVCLSRSGSRVSALVDGKNESLETFVTRVRTGGKEGCYPDSTLVYYSGECKRVQKLISRYRRHFLKLTRKQETDHLKPIFVQSRNDQSQVILLGLFAHRHRDLLSHLDLREMSDIKIILRSPAGYDPERHEPKLWNTEGPIRRVVAALDETSSSQNTVRRTKYSSESSSRDVERIKHDTHVDERTYRFSGGEGGTITDLAGRLERSRDNIYLALENLRARGMFQSVSFKLRGRKARDPFLFDQLSEGEKQLLAVVGAVSLINQKHNLVLLDEPDTHLNPHWSWDYSSMLTGAFKAEQQSRSTVLMATHDPVMISGMMREQVLLAHSPTSDRPLFSRPHGNPRGQGVANLLCSKEYFGLPSSLDKETQKLLDERLEISVKEDLSLEDKARLKSLNARLEISPGISERDPDYVAFLRSRHPNLTV